MYILIIDNHVCCGHVQDARDLEARFTACFFLHLASDMTSTSTSMPFKQVKTLEGHIDSINAIEFSPDGNHLASGGDDARLLIFETGSWKLIKKYGTVSPIRAIAWHQGHPGVISFGLKNGVIHTIQTKVMASQCTERCPQPISQQNDLVFEHIVHGGVQCMAFDAKGRFLAVGFSNEVLITRQASICKRLDI